MDLPHWGDCLVAEGDREVNSPPSPALAFVAIARWLVSAAVVVLAIAAAPIALVAAQSVPGQVTGSVSVAATVAEEVECAAVDATHIDVRANTCWRFTAQTVTGIRTLVCDPTGDAPVRIEIPSGTVRYSVTIEPN